MKLLFLGTAASPSVPIPFCNCHVCQKARAKKGKNIRKKSSLLIDDDLLIDLGPDLPIAFEQYNVDTHKIKYCLQTHLHDDHFCMELLNARHKEYGTLIDKDIVIISSQENIRDINKCLSSKESQIDNNEIINSDFSVVLKPIVPMNKYKIGDYSITAFIANHGIKDECYNYLIEKENFTIYYAVDTSIINDGIFDYLLDKKIVISTLIMDHTYGFSFSSRDRDHLGLNDFIAQINRFKEKNVLAKRSKVLATHLSHEGLLDHKSMNDYAQQNGYMIAYDGMKICT